MNANLKIAGVTAAAIGAAYLIHKKMGAKSPTVLLAGAVIGTFIFSSYEFGTKMKEAA